MRVVICAMLVMVGALCLMIGAAALVPRLGGPYRIAWLDDHNTCELPCWRGITAGVTSFDDALRLVRAMPDVALNSANLAQSGAGPVSFHVQDGSDDVGVSMLPGPSGKLLMMIFTNVSVPVPEIVARFGSPASVNLYEFNAFVSIVFPYPARNMSARLSIRNATRSATRKCPLDRLNATAEIDVDATLDQYHVSYPWRGFSPIADLLCAP